MVQTPVKTVTYHVNKTQIVDSNNFTITTDFHKNSLILVTCYPFDSITTDGPLRYIVYANEAVMREKNI